MAKYVALDTETHKGRAFILSHAKGVVEIPNRKVLARELPKLGKKFVFFNLDYDVSALLRLFPEKAWKKIYVEKRVESGEFWLRYFPKKMFKLAFPGYMATCFDLYSFFQCSLDKAAKLCGIKARKIKLPKNWVVDLKAKYENPRTRGKVSAYAIQDSAVLQKIVDKVQETLAKIGLENCDLYSPGYIAKRFLIKRGVSFGRLPRVYKPFAEAAYHGARIEVFRRGFFPKVYGADIKSAYPFAFANLPEIQNARYHYSKFPETKYYFVKCRVFSKFTHIHLLPYFKGGINYFPRYNGEVAYLSNYEHEFFVKHKLGDLKIVKTLNIECRDTRPYAPLVQELFDNRKLSGLEGIFFKLNLNSMYGIAAETHSDFRELESHVASLYLENNRARESSNAFHILQGRACPYAKRYWERKCHCDICQDTRKVMRYKIPAWVDIDELEGVLYRKQVKGGRLHNVIVAAMVTAQTRVQTYQKLMECKKPIAVFTDGIFSETPIPGVHKKAKLGEWEDTGNFPLLMVGSGVYQFGRLVKMRGFRYKKSLRQLFAKEKRSLIPISQTKRASMGIQVRQNIEDREMNEIFVTNKYLDINFDHKRNWEFSFDSARQMLNTVCESSAKDLLDI